VYVLDNEVPTDVAVMAKCSDSDWTSFGVTALEYVHNAALDGQDMDDLDAGEYYYDDANNDLYYRLAAGESIGDVHLEASDGLIGMIEQSGQVGDIFSIDTEYNIIKYFWVGLANLIGIKVTAANNTMSYVEAFGAKVGGIVFQDSASGTGDYLTASYCDDGVAVVDVTMTLSHILSHHNQDDGLQIYGPGGNGEATVSYSVFHSNGQPPRGEESTDNSGIAIEQAGSVGYLYNNTVYNNYRGFIVDDETTGTLYNNIAEGNTQFDVFEHATATSNTHDYNVFQTSDGWVTAANEIVDDPLFTDSANLDFSLQPSSPAIDAGVDVGLTTDYNGDRVSAYPDIGAYEYQWAVINIGTGSGAITLGGSGTATLR